MLDLGEKELAGEPVPLKLVKFTNVRALAVVSVVGWWVLAPGGCHQQWAGFLMCSPFFPRCYARLQVTVLSVFVESNQGGEETSVLQKIVVSGLPADTFNVAEIKKVEEK